MSYLVETKVKRGFETIKPIYEIIQGRGFIGGSYAAFMAAGHDTPILPNDVDVFAISKDDATEIRRDLESSLRMYWMHETDVASTLEPVIGSAFKMDVQIVRPNPDWKEFPLDIVKSFDMDVCRAVLLNDCTVMADMNVGLLTAKFLRINNPLRSLQRAMKYNARCVKFDEWELLKLFRAWDEIPQDRKQQLITSLDPANQEPDYGWVDDDYFEGE